MLPHLVVWHRPQLTPADIEKLKQGTMSAQDAK